MKIVFAGTPPFSATCLKALLADSSIDVVGVMTQPDRKAGRGMKLTASAVKHLAVAQQLDCITPQTLQHNTIDLAWLQQKEADFLVVVAYGMILPPIWLDAVHIAPINAHASLLPRWRGAAPIERAMLAGDASTGVCIMRMEEGLDTGPIYHTTTLPIGTGTTGSELWSKLAEASATLLCASLKAIKHGDMHAVPQGTQGITYAKKLTANDRDIDWHTSASHIDRLVRCFTVKPGARCRWKNRWLKVVAGIINDTAEGVPLGQIVDVKNGISIACGDGLCYRLEQVQPEGKAIMAAADFARGQRLVVGDSFLP